MGQMCFDCELKIYKNQMDREAIGEHVVDLCNSVLAWKNEAVNLGYSDKGAIRLEYEDSKKPVSPKYLVDQWTRLREKNESLEKEIETLKNNMDR